MTSFNVIVRVIIATTAVVIGMSRFICLARSSVAVAVAAPSTVTDGSKASPRPSDTPNRKLRDPSEAQVKGNRNHVFQSTAKLCADNIGASIEPQV